MIVAIQKSHAIGDSIVVVAVKEDCQSVTSDGSVLLSQFTNMMCFSEEGCHLSLF
jgi:hypothetical protein